MLNRIKISFWPSVVTLTAFVLLCKLGFWQLERAEEKRIWLTEFENLHPLPLSQLQTAIDQAQLSTVNGRQFQLEGKVISQYTAYLDNRVFQGQTGYKVIAPVQIDALDAWLLVDFGWVKGPRSRASLPDFNLPDSVALTGLIKSTNLGQFMLADNQLTSQWPQRVQAVEQLLTHAWPKTVLPLLVYANDQQVSGLVQTYKPVVMKPEKHQAYAVQWFLLALASIVIFLFASRVKSPAPSQT